MANNFTDSVTIPATQSLITGTLAGILAGSTASMANFPQAAQFGLTAGAMVALVAWLDYRGRWQSLLERILQVDINRDGQIGQPIEQEPMKQEPLKIFVEQDQGRHTTILDLPLKAEQLTAFADGVLTGRQLSQAAWTGRGQPFSRSEFDMLRSELIRRGLAQWRTPGEPAQGWELLTSGRAMLRHFSSEAPAPLKAVHVVKVR